MTTIQKVLIEPVASTDIKHHRELPEGHYRVELSAFGSRRYLLYERNSKKRYLIFWCGEGRIFREFIITPNGVINEESGLPDNPGC